MNKKVKNLILGATVSCVLVSPLAVNSLHNNVTVQCNDSNYKLDNLFYLKSRNGEDHVCVLKKLSVSEFYDNLDCYVLGFHLDYLSGNVVYIDIYNNNIVTINGFEDYFGYDALKINKMIPRDYIKNNKTISFEDLEQFINYDENENNYKRKYKN